MGEIHDYLVAVHFHAGVSGRHAGEGLDAIGVVQGQVAEPFAHLPFLRGMHLKGFVRVYQVRRAHNPAVLRFAGGFVLLLPHNREFESVQFVVLRKRCEFYLIDR